MTGAAQEHWDAVYRTTAPDDVSWFQARPATSLRLLSEVAGQADAVLDVGAGASTLADELLDAGWADVTVLDVSEAALAQVRDRLAGRHPEVRVVVADLLRWVPERTYDVWHDRAVLHFLTDEGDRARYARTAALAVPSGGHLVVGAFAEDGPPRCSGLPTVRYGALQLAAVLGDTVDLVHAEREEHRTPGGVVQPFTWVVLRRR